MAQIPSTPRPGGIASIPNARMGVPGISAADFGNDTRHSISSLAAIPYAILDITSFDTLLNAMRAYSPGGKWAFNSLLKPMIGEGINEGGQSVVGSIAGEYGRSFEEDYSLDIGKFISDTASNAALEGVYGALTGGTMGFAGSRPYRLMREQGMWKRGQLAIDSGVEKLKSLPEWKKNPAKAQEIVETVLDKSGTPKTMFQRADEVYEVFQEQSAELSRYLESVDVTEQDFSRALNAGADIEISVSGMIRYQASENANQNAQKISRPTPDAPTVGIIADQEQAKQDMLVEYNRLQQENQPLPEPFAILKQQIIDAGHDAAMAAYETDMTYAGAVVAGKRMGLTAEQFVNLNPIQVVLANSLRKARSAGEIGLTLRNNALEREERTAAREYVRYQQDQRKKGRRFEFVNGSNGSADLGILDLNALADQRLRGAGMEDGPVRLEKGTRHFGKIHIEKNHQDALENAGVETAEELVEFVLDNLIQIRTANNGRYRLVAKGSDANTIVINLVHGEENHYTVTTAAIYPVGRKMPGEVLWDGSDAHQQDSGDPARISYPGAQDRSSQHSSVNGQNTSPDNMKARLQQRPSAAPDLGGPTPLTTSSTVEAQSGEGLEGVGNRGSVPLFTIPVTEGNVNSWNDEALATILREAGIDPAVNDIYTQYARNQLESGRNIQDAGALVDEVNSALQFATENMEGFEQAAQGLERILARPEDITQSILDARGIGAQTLQEGIAELRSQMEQYRMQADAWRNIEQRPDLIPQALNQNGQAQGVRGSTVFLPHITTVRLFNGLQNRSTFSHEIFHFYFHALEKFAVRNPDSEAAKDYAILNNAVAGRLTDPDEQIRIAAEEDAATMWEKYLMEGRAPTPGLAGAFRRFRSWLTNVYRNASRIERTILPDDVRGVFDRMLAGEVEIAVARNFYDDMQQYIVPADMPEERKAVLAEAGQRARTTAEDRQIAALVKAHIQAIGGRKAFREAARNEVGQGRAFKTIRALKDIGGLTREEVESEVGEKQAGKIFKNHRGVIKEKRRSAKAPADMTATANEYGYASQYDMVKAIVEADTVNMPTDPASGEVDRRAFQAIKTVKEHGGLDELYVLDNFGSDVAARLRKEYGAEIFSRETGKVGALIEAERYNYESLADMLNDIAETASYTESVNARVEQMIAVEEAEVRRIAVEDAATPADEAYHNEEYSDYLAMKQRYLQEEATRQALREGRRAERMLSNRALKEAAAINVGNKKAQRAGQYHIEVEAFKRHGENSLKAERAGDKITAAKELQLQRLAHYGIREALTARKELDAFEKRNRTVATVQRLDGRNGKPRVEFKFREVIKDIMTTFKLTDSIRLRPEKVVGAEVAIPGHDATPEIAAVLPALSEAIPEWIKKREGAEDLKSWKDLTLNQVRELNEALIALEKLGRGELEALKLGQWETLSILKNDSIARMMSRKSRPKEYDRETIKGKALNFLDSIGVGALIPEYILAIADGNTGITGKGIGPLQSAMVELRRRLGEKSAMVRKTNEKIEPALQVLRRYRERFGKIDQRLFGELPEGLRQGRGKGVWTGEHIIMIALNSGNAGNLQAILDGYGISNEQWQTIASTLRDLEWDAIQTIWDVFGEYFPLIDEVTFRQVNKHVAQVEAQPFTVVTADGIEKTLNGGYFPLIFDSLVDADMGRIQDIEMSLNRAHSQSIHGYARIANNFTLARKTDEDGNPVTKRPPLLRLDLITTHIDKVAHYVALADAISEMDRLTLDEEWAAVFRDKFGQRYYDMVRKYIKDVADPDAGNLENDGLRKSLEWLRHKATVAALGLRVVTGLKQRLDYFPAALHMSLHSRTGASGFKYLLYGMREIGWKGNLGMMNEKIQRIFEKSNVMRDRDGNVTADIREMISKTRGDKAIYNMFGIEFTSADINNAFFAWIQMNDRAAACAVWLGAYKMALDGNGSFDSSAMTSPAEIEAAAVRDADMAAATLASSTLADLTAWQREKGVHRLFTTFLSGTVRRTSRMAQYLDAVKRGDITKQQFLSNFIVDAALQAWVPAFMYMGIKALTGDDDEKPSMWDFFSTLFIDPVTTTVEGVPFVNMFSSGINYGARSAFTPAALDIPTLRPNSTTSTHRLAPIIGCTAPALRKMGRS